MSDYRFVLRRTLQAPLFDSKGSLLWVLLNPSTATETMDDQTILKVKEFTRLFGFLRLTVVNLFAYRATKSAELWSKLAAGIDVVGPDNDAIITAEATQADAVCCAWGKMWRPIGRAREQHVLELLWQTSHRDLFCVGRNKDGTPLHPCFAAYTAKPRVWRRRGETP